VTELNADGVSIGTYTVGNYPEGIAIDPSGNIWVANNGDNTVTELSPTGITIGTYTVGYYPDGIAIDASGNIWVTNSGDFTVTELSPAGETLGVYAVGSGPVGISIDAAGDVLVLTNPGGITVLYELVGAAKGPQYWPYPGPVFPGGGNY
jgi:DNA-binding beta-propeller fold protein YncE